MPVFKDENEVYRYIGKLFEDLTMDEELSPKFRRADTIVQYKYTNPDSQITVKMKEGEEGQMKAKGPVAKILKLVPLVKPVFPKYKAMLEKDNRDDLLKAAA